jgi:hypothetical protein
MHGSSADLPCWTRAQTTVSSCTFTSRGTKLPNRAPLSCTGNSDLALLQGAATRDSPAELPHRACVPYSCGEQQHVAPLPSAHAGCARGARRTSARSSSTQVLARAPLQRAGAVVASSRCYREGGARACPTRAGFPTEIERAHGIWRKWMETSRFLPNELSSVSSCFDSCVCCNCKGNNNT